jgi:signal peptidase I
MFSEINHSNLGRRGTDVKPFSILNHPIRRFFYFYAFWMIASQIYLSGEGWLYRAASWTLFLSGALLLLFPQRNLIHDPQTDGRAPLFQRRLRHLLLLIIISLHLRISMVERVVVSGESMEPTLKEGEGVWFEKISVGTPLPNLTFPFGEILPEKIVPNGIVQLRHGEIILFKYPGLLDGDHESWIKRVIALPGDYFEFRAGTIFINGSVVSGVSRKVRTEPYTEIYQPPVITPPPILERYPPEVLYSAINGCGLSGRVPDGTLLVLGDNRPRSRDSRSIGFVPIRFVKGRILGGESL